MTTEKKITIEITESDAEYLFAVLYRVGGDHHLSPGRKACDKVLHQLMQQGIKNNSVVTHINHTKISDESYLEHCPAKINGFIRFTDYEYPDGKLPVERKHCPVCNPLPAIKPRKPRKPRKPKPAQTES